MKIRLLINQIMDEAVKYLLLSIEQLFTDSQIHAFPLSSARFL